MLRSLTPMVKTVVLCCGLAFIAAAEDDCIIRVINEDVDDGCEDTASVCNLDCELAVNDAGCPLCQCAELPPPSACTADGDCRENQRCEVVDACPACVNDPVAPCEIACTLEGRCVDFDVCTTVLCAADTVCTVDACGFAVCVPNDREFCGDDGECGEGRFCDFSQGGADDGSSRPAPPPDGSDGDMRVGVCREAQQVSCANVRCGEASHCVESIDGPVCMPLESECDFNTDCGPGARCEIFCGSSCDGSTDPEPSCDTACHIIGQCVPDNDDCAALCGADGVCLVNADGSLSCELVREAECVSDQQCATGACNAAEVCLSNPGCADDSACTEECWGFCIERQPAAECVSDQQCATGACNAGEVCLSNPSCGTGEPCTDECWGFCIER